MTETTTEINPETRTLHWYFSIGTFNRDTHYYLDESLAARFEGHDAFDLSRVLRLDRKERDRGSA